jgi:flagellar FliL protein
MKRLGRAGKAGHCCQQTGKIFPNRNHRNVLLTIRTYLHYGDAGVASAALFCAFLLPGGSFRNAMGPSMAAAKAKQAETETDKEPEGDAGGGEKPAKAKGKFSLKLSRKMMIIVGAAVLVLGGGAGGWFYFSHGAKKKEHVEVKPATFVDLPEVLVNLSNAGNDRTQYLKVKVTLEVPDKEIVPHIQPLMPRVMDAFQTYLRELRPTDLDGSAGLYRLKEELTRRVNVAVAPNKITAVLFKEIVVQ